MILPRILNLCLRNEMKAKYKIRFKNIYLVSIQSNEVKMEKEVITVICSIAFDTLGER